MHLISYLLFAVAVLTILTGLSVLFGAAKQSKSNAIWFFVATIGSATWSSSISSFLALPEGADNLVPILVTGILAGITLTDVALLGYTGWKEKFGKGLTIFFLTVGALIIGALIANPGLFYSGFALSNVDFNRIFVVKDWYYYLLIIFFTLITITFTTFLSNQIKHSTNKNLKVGRIIFFVGLSVDGILALVFDLMLLQSVPSLIWIGPMAVSVTMLTFYYSVVRYRVLTLSTKWMKLLSYIIFMIFGGILYLLIFFAVFTALFRIPNPSASVLLLNLIMAAIVICLVPAIREVTSFMNSLISMRQINIGYITKKLIKLSGQNVDPKELAGFLADHLHYEYVGFLINDRIYGSSALKANTEEVDMIIKLGAPENGIWQKPSEKAKKAFSRLEISDVAALFDEKGKQFGQIILGKPFNRRESLTRSDFVQIEAVINLAALTISSKKRSKRG